MPALPYTYIGRWQENGRTVVYLQENGESVVQVHGPGQLNDRYTVESVADDRLVLKDKPTGTRQTLLFARAATAGGTGAAPAGAEAAASGGSQEEN